MLRAYVVIVFFALLGCSKVHETVDVSEATDSEIGFDTSLSPRDSSVPDALVPSDGSVLPTDGGVPTLDGAVDAEVDARVLIDVCDNPDDLAGLADLGTNIGALLQEQGVPCFLQSMGGPQFAMCIADALSDTLTPDCALCVGQQADCLVSNCLTNCIADQGGGDCLACVCNAGCVDAFADCSGVDFGLFSCPDA